MVKALGLIKLSDVNILCVAKFVFNQLSSPEPIIQYVRANEIHNYNTRQNNNLRPYRHLDISHISRKFIAYKGCHIWNQLPNNIKTVLNVNTFKIKLKKYLLSLY